MDIHRFHRAMKLYPADFYLLVMLDYDSKIEASSNPAEIQQLRDSRARYLEIFHTELETVIRDSCS